MPTIIGFRDLTSRDIHRVGRGVRVVWSDSEEEDDQRDPKTARDGSLYTGHELRPYVGDRALIWDPATKTWWPSRIVELKPRR